MAKALDLTGRVFGELTVLKRLPNQVTKSSCKSYWFVRCTCGQEYSIRGSRLTRSGETRTCSRCSHIHHGHSRRRNVSPTYRCWQSMISRCYIKSATGYVFYGGRGISVCDRWRNSFDDFLEDMGEKPSNRSLDRIDNNGDYELANCR